MVVQKGSQPMIALFMQEVVAVPWLSTRDKISLLQAKNQQGATALFTLLASEDYETALFFIHKVITLGLNNKAKCKLLKPLSEHSLTNKIAINSGVKHRYIMQLMEKNLTNQDLSQTFRIILKRYQGGSSAIGKPHNVLDHNQDLNLLLLQKKNYDKIILEYYQNYPEQCPAPYIPFTLNYFLTKLFALAKEETVSLHPGLL